MAGKRGQEQEDNSENIPREIWLEIHSRLPIKDVFKYQCVAKSWNPIPHCFSRKILSQPICGLLLRDATYLLETDVNSRITYIPKCATQSISIRTDIAINKPFAVSSGFKTGYLRDTSIEFGPLSSLPEGQFFTVDNGLILTSHRDGTYHIYNPVTKQVLHLPMSPIVVKFGIHERYEICAFLHNYKPLQYDACFSFLVMRLIPRVRRAEMFFGDKCKWYVYKLKTNDADGGKVLNSSWCCENSVYVSKFQTLFLLTKKEQGLAVRFVSEKIEGKRRHRAWVYNVPLPEVVKGGFRRARLGGDQEGECVHLSYYDNYGRAWFWKRNGETPTYNNQWVLLLKIGNTPKVSKSLEDNHKPLFNLLKQGDSIIPIGFYPRSSRPILRVKSTFYIYSMIKKKMIKFAEISDQDFNSSLIVLPYVPLLVPFKFARKPGRLKPISIDVHLDMLNHDDNDDDNEQP